MLRYVVKRFLAMIPTLFVIMTVTFFIIRLVPGGPFSREKQLPEQVLKNLEAKYHLDEPLWKQYFRYMGDILFRLDFGPSFRSRVFTVNDIIKRKFPVSFQVGVEALLVALVFGLTFGIISALYRNKWPDYLFTGISVLGISIPMFVIASLFILVLARWLRLVPVAGWGDYRYHLIPVLSLAWPYMAYITRLTKVGIVENMHKDYVTTARAKGLPESTILVKHVLKGSLIPVASFLGPAFAGIVTGSMVVESICNIPGIGVEFVQSAFNRDYTVITGITIVYATLLVFMNFVVDMVYALLDPRIRYK
ncbi:Oligopeptide transport system permease protein OppB [Brevinematales bacterium NS]|nr:ABC transporter permease subunit [Brevinematales bacterium]QJR21465.1 Oligopeptide transport system permease protein OppB [Brevinematales bacterium NS]